MPEYMRKMEILPVCTNNDARAYFAQKGLTYDDITEGDMARYMDDIVIFGASKKTIHAAMDAIDRFLWDNFRLQVKKNWQVFRMEYTVTEYAIRCRKLSDLYALAEALGVKYRIKMHHGRRMIFLRATARNEAAMVPLLEQFGATARTVRMTHGRPLDFMGFEFHRNRTILRKSTGSANSLAGSSGSAWPLLCPC